MTTTRLQPRRLSIRLSARGTCSALLLACLGFITVPAQSHEFWMLADEFTGPPGRSTSLTMSVGENFAGDRIGISQPLLASFQWFAAGRSADLRGSVPPATPVGEIPVQLPQAGTHLFAVDTQPSHITLSADKFHAYLHDEGLDHIVKQREAAGTAATPGRERFRRNIKALLQAGSKTDATFAVRAGQRLEIVPLANPYRRGALQDIGFQVLFDGQPLARALVKSWHRKGSQTLIIRTVTDEQGKASVTPPWSGVWMVSVVHMVPVTDTTDHDWDSYWGNLSFELPAAKAAR